MIPNPGKCSFMLLGFDDSLQTNLACDNEIFKKIKQENVLGVTLANKLNFAIYLPNITKNRNKKFNVLTQAQKNMTDQESLYNPTLLNRNLSAAHWSSRCLYKTFSFQNEQYTWTLVAPYTAKLHIWIWKTLRECKLKITSPEMHWILFDWGL